MNRLVLLFSALRYGSQLSNVEAWKIGGVAVASLTGLLSALTGLAATFGYLPSGVSEETLVQASSAIVTLVGMALAYLQVATTKKIGIPVNEEPPVETTEALPVLHDDGLGSVVHPAFGVQHDEPEVLSEADADAGYWAHVKQGGFDNH